MEWDKVFSLLWLLLLKRGVGHYVGRRWWEPELGITQPRMGLHGLVVGKKQLTGWVDIAALAAAIPQSRTVAQRLLSAQGCERDIALIINQCIFSWIAQTCFLGWNKHEQKTDADYPRLLSNTHNRVIALRACSSMWFYAYICQVFFNYDDLSAMGELDVEGGRCVHLFLCSYTRLAAFQKSWCSLPVMFFKKTDFTDLKQSCAYSPHYLLAGPTLAYLMLRSWKSLSRQVRNAWRWRMPDACSSKPMSAFFGVQLQPSNCR